MQKHSEFSIIVSKARGPKRTGEFHLHLPWIFIHKPFVLQSLRTPVALQRLRSAFCSINKLANIITRNHTVDISSLSVNEAAPLFLFSEHKVPLHLKRKHVIFKDLDPYHGSDTCMSVFPTIQGRASCQTPQKCHQHSCAKYLWIHENPDLYSIQDNIPC